MRKRYAKRDAWRPFVLMTNAYVRELFTLVCRK